MTEKDTRLFSEFSPVSNTRWKEKIREELKGLDPEKLVWKTKEGISVNPFYTGEDMNGLEYLESSPGEYPFIRGNNNEINSWFIRQDICVENPASANLTAVEAYRKGADSFGFIFGNARDYSQNDFKLLLKDLPLEKIEINFDASKGSSKLLNLLKEYIKTYYVNSERIIGSLNFDPLKSLNLRGKFCKNREHSFDRSYEMVKNGIGLDNFKIISINAKDFHNAGSSISQVVAFSLAQANEYISELSDRGLSIEEIVSNIKFNFAVGSNYFMEIAKFRAARLLWANIINVYNSSKKSSARMFIHAETSSWNKTIYDPYVNMLRSTTESMSAILAGVDSLTVLPYDKAFRKESDFSQRMARNQQIILKEESFFDKVKDPSAGSFYIENMTDKIAWDAWNIFLGVEKRGGYINCFLDNYIQDSASTTAQQRDMNIAQRKEILLGTNQFPDFNETANIKNGIENDMPIEYVINELDAQPLCIYRGAEAFEEMRIRTENAKRKRPKVFLLTYGNLVMSKARATFSSNFFGCAGFEIINNQVFDTIDEGINIFLKSASDILVICSSDEEYPIIAPEINKRIKNKSFVIVAGYPEKYINELKMSGIENFIHIKSNLLELLNDFQEKLGIE